MTADIPAALAALASVANLRDAGGQPTRDGRRVRTGRLYRSGSLHQLDEAGVAALASLGLRRVVDLRADIERAAAPDRLPPSVEVLGGDVLADWVDGSPARLVALIDDPAAAQRELGGGRLHDLWIEQYRRLVNLDSARRVYGRLFAELARPEALPLLVHCAGGKDRTGWAVAALLLWLGVPDEAVMAEYLRSDWERQPAAAAMLEALAARGGDPDLWRPLLAAEPSYLEAAMDEVGRSFGSIDAYVRDGLGLSPAVRDELRAVLLD